MLSQLHAFCFFVLHSVKAKSVSFHTHAQDVSGVCLFPVQCYVTELIINRRVLVMHTPVISQFFNGERAVVLKRNGVSANLKYLV